MFNRRKRRTYNTFTHVVAFLLAVVICYLLSVSIIYIYNLTLDSQEFEAPFVNALTFNQYRVEGDDSQVVPVIPKQKYQTSADDLDDLLAEIDDAMINLKDFIEIDHHVPLSGDQLLLAVDEHLHENDPYRQFYSYGITTSSRKVKLKLIFTDIYIFKMLFNNPSLTYDQDVITASNHIDSILTQHITNNMSDYQKSKAIYDYITMNLSYDHSLQVREVTEALQKGISVCQGYAQLYSIMCDRVGLESIYVVGDALPIEPNSPGHAWNLVKLDGEFYHVDATWGTPFQLDNKRLNYAYCHLDDTIIGRDHTWDQSMYPSGTTMKQNYYYMNNLVAFNLSDIKRVYKQNIVNEDFVQILCAFEYGDGKPVFNQFNQITNASKSRSYHQSGSVFAVYEH